MTLIAMVVAGVILSVTPALAAPPEIEDFCFAQIERSGHPLAQAEATGKPSWLTASQTLLLHLQRNATDTKSSVRHQISPLRPSGLPSTLSKRHGERST